jgi:hypothetical protein
MSVHTTELCKSLSVHTTELCKSLSVHITELCKSLSVHTTELCKSLSVHITELRKSLSVRTTELCKSLSFAQLKCVSHLPEQTEVTSISVSRYKPDTSQNKLKYYCFSQLSWVSLIIPCLQDLNILLNSLLLTCSSCVTFSVTGNKLRINTYAMQLAYGV